MGRVVVECEDVPGVELAEMVRDALAQARDVPHSAGLVAGSLADSCRITAAADRPGPRAPGPPSARYGPDTRAKIQSGRLEAVTPGEVAAWWAARYFKSFECEDPALQAARGWPEAEAAVRQALRRHHGGKQRSLLAYLTATLKWWVSRRARGDRRASGYPRLREVLTSDWKIGLWRSGDMRKETDP